MSNAKPAEPADSPLGSRQDAVRLIRQKLLGAALCAVVGAACGWLFAQNDGRHHSVQRYLMVGGLAAAMAGGLLAGGRFGRVGLGVIIGASIGVLVEVALYPGHDSALRDPVWALTGFLVGLTIGSVAEYAASTLNDYALSEDEPGW